MGFIIYTNNNKKEVINKEVQLCMDFIDWQRCNYVLRHEFTESDEIEIKYGDKKIEGGLISLVWFFKKEGMLLA